MPDLGNARACPSAQDKGFGHVPSYDFRRAIHEFSHLWFDELPVCVDEAHRQLRSDLVQQNRYEPAFVHVIGDDRGCDQRESETLDCRFADKIDFIGMESTTDRNRSARPERPSRVRCPVAKNTDDAVLASQVLAAPGFADFRQVGRRGDDDQPVGMQVAGDQVLIPDDSDPHGDVDAFAEEVDVARRRLHLDPHLGKLAQKIDE